MEETRFNPAGNRDEWRQTVSAAMSLKRHGMMKGEAGREEE